MTITEECSCGAKIAVTGGEYRNDKDSRNPRGAEEVVERWRVEHKHEFPPIEPMPEEPPTIVESGSSHERAADEFPPERALIGFQRA